VKRLNPFQYNAILDCVKRPNSISYHPWVHAWVRQTDTPHHRKLYCNSQYCWWYQWCRLKVICSKKITSKFKRYTNKCSLSRKQTCHHYQMLKHKILYRYCVVQLGNFSVKNFSFEKCWKVWKHQRSDKQKRVNHDYMRHLYINFYQTAKIMRKLSVPTGSFISVEITAFPLSEKWRNWFCMCSR